MIAVVSESLPSNYNDSAIRGDLMEMIDMFDSVYQCDEIEHQRPVATKRSKPRWRDVERVHERRRVAREIVRDHERYFDLLDKYPSLFDK